MKKAALLLLIAVLSFNLAQAQSDWASYRIDNKLSVKLPSAPDRKDENNMAAVEKDSSFYFVSIIDLDTNKVAQILNNPAFANGLKNAIIGNMKGFTLADMKRGNWKGYPSFQSDGDNAPSHLKLYFTMLIVGGRIYCFGIVVPESQNTKRKSNFLDLLSLN